MEKNYIKIGKIIDTRALKGEVKVYPYTNAIESFDNVEQVIIKEKSADVILEVEKARPYKNIMVLKFKGIDDINDVLKYKGEYIYLSVDEMDNLLEEGEFFVKDLIGLDVVKETGEKIGVVDDLRTGKSQDLLTINSNGKIWFLPYVDQFVVAVDIEQGFITVKLIEGLYDED